MRPRAPGPQGRAGTRCILPMMPLRRSHERSRWILLGLALYALILVGTPLFHHDVACHVKSPTHCTACVASPLASRVEDGVALRSASLPEAGRVVETREASAPFAVLVDSPGRAPPA